MTHSQKVFAALSSPIRREILWRVWREELPAGAIAKAFDITAPSISQHLSVLLDAGLVTMRADGNFRRYRAVPEAVRGLEPSLFESRQKWAPLEGRPEARQSSARVGLVVTVSVEVACDQQAAFSAFSDPHQYSRWMRASVSIENGQFSLMTGHGTRVRGTYDHVVSPSLIVMTWDHEVDAELPVPGRGQRAYLTVEPSDGGARVTVHQLIESSQQAAYMESIWRTVLGRLHTAFSPATRPPRASTQTARAGPRRLNARSRARARRGRQPR